LAFYKRRENYLFEELKVSRGIKDSGKVIKKKIKKWWKGKGNQLHAQNIIWDKDF
jgi:hypothetical protein